VEEFAAVATAGFDTVGRVTGTASYVELTDEPGRWNVHDCLAATVPVALSGAGAPSAAVVDARERALRASLDRMRAACSALGGHGVLAVRLTTTPSRRTMHGTDLTLTGTAVWAHSPVTLRRPFSSHLDGPGFAKLLRAGWVPVELVIAWSIGVRHGDARSVEQSSSSVNVEMSGLTELVNGVRADARVRLEKQIAERGGDGVILADSALQVWEQGCPNGRRADPLDGEPEDHLAEFTLTGTSIARFADGPIEPRALTVLPLNGGTAQPTYRRGRTS
jgi:uncharacterized protein YbjQ (UPF0145 family)